MGLEKKHGQNRVIHSLFTGIGQELVDLGQIRERAVFFSSLYASEYNENGALFEELPQVSEETNLWLDKPLQLD